MRHFNEHSDADWVSQTNSPSIRMNRHADPGILHSGAVVGMTQLSHLVPVIEANRVTM